MLTDTKSKEPAVGTLLWTFMITGASNDPWIDDMVFPLSPMTGMRTASVVRLAKLLGIEAVHATVVGRIDPLTLSRALDYLAHGRRA